MENNYSNSWQPGFDSPPPAPQAPMFTIGDIRKIAWKKLKGKWGRSFAAFCIYYLLMEIPAAVLALLTDPQYGILEKAPDWLDILSDAFTIYAFIVSGAFSISIAAMSLKVIRGERFGPGVMFEGFGRFGQGFVTYLLSTLFSLLWLMLITLPGTILLSVATVANTQSLLFAAYALLFTLAIVAVVVIMKYRMCYFIAWDNPNMKARRAIEWSVSMMKGHRMEYFMLVVSFIGWGLIPCACAMATGCLYVFGAEQNSPILFFGAVCFGIFALIASALLMVYIYVASAVFYSGISGNYRTAASADDTAEFFTEPIDDDHEI